MAFSSPIELGPFTLDDEIGEGGMGLVFAATHRRRSKEVAIKVMTAEQAQRPRAHRAFQREVQAMARLNHRHIIRIFDAGKIPVDADRSSGGTLLTGSPYLVMERAQASLLALDREALSWPHVQTILQQILDGLAHSHAQGVIHRDLKPGNILIAPRRDRFRLVLTDFGIAQAIHRGLDDSPSGAHPDDGDQPRRIIGTPRYMAPEQIQAATYDQGPWTDLYAVGCLAHWLCCGVPPFSGPTAEVLKDHCRAPRPPLMARIAVPRGFQAWVSRLMATDPRQRFRRAADASLALHQISPADQADPQVPVDDGPSPPSRGTPSTLIITEEPTQQLSTSPPPLPPDDSSPLAPPPPIERIPSSWRDLPAQPAPTEMAGVGLGLFGRRPPPLVARKYERDHLWQVLLDAIAITRPHGAVLTGPAGIGKTRLAWWLASQAHELGAANVLHISHNPTANASDELRRLFADYLNVDQRSLPQLLELLRHLLRDDLTDAQAPLALATLLQSPDTHARTTRFDAREERFALWRTLLEALGRRRPLILLADDIQWGYETLAFLNYLFDAPDPPSIPLSVIATARDETLTDRPRVRDQLEHLHHRPWVHHLALDPLDTEDHTRLISAMVQLDPAEESRVVEQTRGNPLFAIQLIGDWIQHGRLQVGPQGFSLDTTAHQQTPLPDSIHQLLTERLQHVLHTIAPHRVSASHQALELAAVLGRQIERHIWQQAIDKAQLQVPPDLVENLGAQGLIDIEDRGFRFTQGALRETLLQRADELGRLADYHRYCATALVRTFPDRPLWLSPRLAHHFLGAGDHRQALEALLDESHFHQLQSRFDDSLQTLERFQQLRRNRGIPDADRRVLRAWLERATTELRLLNVAAAQPILQQCLTLASEHNWSTIIARCHLNLARAARLEGLTADGFEHGQQALQRFQELGDLPRVAEALHQLSWLHRWKGDIDEAQQAVEEAIDIMADIAPGSDRHARVQNLLGIILINRGDYEQGLHYTQQALDVFRRHGNLSAQVGSLNNLGEMSRQQGRTEQAREHYEQACRLASKLGGQRDRVSRINLAWVGLQTGDYHTARRELAQLMDQRPDKALRSGYHLALAIGLLCAYAGLGDWEAFDAQLTAIQDYDLSAFVDRDLAQALQWGADLCREADEPQRAEAAADLARIQWDVLDGNH